MKLSELKPVNGATRDKKRVGRGTSSGYGKTSGRGHKGQNARSGGGVRLGFEGGQTPLFKRLPKRGFSNIFRKEFAIVNLSSLNRYPDDTIITPELLLEDRIISNLKSGLKVLAKGKLERKLTVKAHKFSKSALEEITSLGGLCEVI